MVQTVVIDPLAIVTEGLLVENRPNVVDVLGIATRGLCIVITEEVIEVPDRNIYGHGTLVPHEYTPPKKKKKKRITARVRINEVEYSDTIEVDDLTITARDVLVEVKDTPVPQLKITVMRGKK